MKNYTEQELTQICKDTITRDTGKFNSNIILVENNIEPTEENCELLRKCVQNATFEIIQENFSDEYVERLLDDMKKIEMIK